MGEGGYKGKCHIELGSFLPGDRDCANDYACDLSGHSTEMTKSITNVYRILKINFSAN